MRTQSQANRLSSMEDVSVEALRSWLDPQQRAVINRIWEHYRDNGEWIRSRRVRLEFREEGGQELLSSLCGNIVYEPAEHSKSHRRYELTLLGMLLTDRGPRYDSLLNQYIKYACRRIEEDPELDELSSEDVTRGLDLDEQDATELGMLLWVGHVFGGGGLNGPSGWRIGLPDDIEDFVGVDDATPYVHDLALRDFDPNTPIEGNARFMFLTTRVAEEIQEGAVEGWEEVHRCIEKMQEAVKSGRRPEDFQVVGFHARGLLITLAQTVHDQETQPSFDGVEPSLTDAKRRLDSFFNAVLPGESSEEIRRVCKATLSLANGLVHRRTATILDAECCLEATTSVVNLAAIAQGCGESTA